MFIFDKSQNLTCINDNDNVTMLFPSIDIDDYVLLKLSKIFNKFYLSTFIKHSYIDLWMEWSDIMKDTRRLINGKCRNGNI